MDLDAVQASVIVTLISASAFFLTRRRWWIRPWIGRRAKRGNLSLGNWEFESCGDFEKLNNFVRMDKLSFELLHDLIEDKIKKQNTHLRETISAKDRLILTLRFLATGESFQSLSYTFRIGQSTISEIIPNVCRAIYDTLKINYLQAPTTTASWLNISREFEMKWNLPNILGAMDGKHIVFRAPRKAGSAYFNYKQQHSIVLLALVDANYKFIYVDVGTNGRVSDGGVHRKSSLCRAIETNMLNFPEERPLPGRAMPVPFVIVGDAAFPLTNNILKPFPFRGMSGAQRIFNYRLSRVRRVVENAFGILANKWRVLLTTLHLSAEKVELITLACCALHNFCRTHCPTHDTNERTSSGNDLRFIHGLTQQGGNRTRNESLRIREEFMDYVNNEGRVPWQDNLF